MRKVIEYCLVSADGIMLEDPFPFRDHLDDAYLRDRLGCDAMLFGRTTYERLAKRWPPGSEVTRPYTARLNAIRKYVFSSKLETAEWNNAIIVRGDVTAEVTKLKQQDGGDLLILGHGLLGETLPSAGGAGKWEKLVQAVTMNDVKKKHKFDVVKDWSKLKAEHARIEKWAAGRREDRPDELRQENVSGLIP